MDVNTLARLLHFVYQQTAKDLDDVRHPDAYDDLEDHIKEYDRAIARFVLEMFVLKADASKGSGRWKR